MPGSIGLGVSNQSFFHGRAIESGWSLRPSENAAAAQRRFDSRGPVGADFRLVDAPFDHPPGEASGVLQVDQSERRWNVRLPNGISANSHRVAIAASV